MGKKAWKVRCKYDELVHSDELMAARNPRNANAHPPEQVKQLSVILKYQGWRKPIVISKRSKRLTAGEGRLLAAILDGQEKVPVEYQAYDSDEQEFADLHADNAIAKQSVIDFSRVQEETARDFDSVDRELLGFRDFNPEREVPEKKKVEFEVNTDKTVKCPKCGHRF